MAKKAFIKRGRLSKVSISICQRIARLKWLKMAKNADKMSQKYSASCKAFRISVLASGEKLLNGHQTKKIPNARKNENFMIDLVLSLKTFLLKVLEKIVLVC